MPPRRRDPDLLRRVGARIRQVRVERGLSQEALALTVRMQPATLSRVEGGRLGISLSMLAALAEALRVQPSSLLDFGGDPRGAPEPRVEAELSPRERRVVSLMRRMPARVQDALVGVAFALAGD